MSHFVHHSNNQQLIKMKIFILGLALLAIAQADVSELGYDYHPPATVEHHVTAPVPAAPTNVYIPPAPAHHAPAPAPVHHAPAPAPVHHAPAPAPAHHAPAPAPVHHAPAPATAHHHESTPAIPQNTYIPPAPSAPSTSSVAAQAHHHVPAPAPAPAAPPAQAPAPAPAQAPAPAPAPAPVAPQSTYIPPAVQTSASAEQTAQLADDGYHYKTIRRRIYRYRF